MEKKYRAWQLAQVISCICYAILVIFLYVAMSADLSNATIVITAILATCSLIATTLSGIFKGFIRSKMGYKATKKDWLIAGFALILFFLYQVSRYL